jgi:hypothetical protein
LGRWGTMTRTTVDERIPLSRADRARRADAMQVRETERYHGAASDRWTDGVSRGDLIALRSAISRGCPVPGDVRRAIAAAWSRPSTLVCGIGRRSTW